MLENNTNFLILLNVIETNTEDSIICQKNNMDGL